MLDHKLKASTYSILLLGFPYSTILYLKTQGRKNKKSSWEQSEAIEKKKNNNTSQLSELDRFAGKIVLATQGHNKWHWSYKSDGR